MENPGKRKNVFDDRDLVFSAGGRARFNENANISTLNSPNHTMSDIVSLRTISKFKSGNKVIEKQLNEI